MEGLLSVMDGPVLDPFMGSGTVGLACAARGLPYIGIEVVEAYFEVALTRLRVTSAEIREIDDRVPDGFMGQRPLR